MIFFYGISHKTVYRGCSAPLIGIGQVRHGMHFILATLIGQGTAVPFFVYIPTARWLLTLQVGFHIFFF